MSNKNEPKNTCCSLNCRLIPFCSKYNNGVDRGEKCEIFEEIKDRIAKTEADWAAAAKRKRIRLKETLEGRAETLEAVFTQLKMDDMKVAVKGMPGCDFHIIVTDSMKNVWKDGEIYEFLINEALGWNPDGSLQFGYGNETSAIRKMAKDAERYYGVKKAGVKYEP